MRLVLEVEHMKVDRKDYRKKFTSKGELFWAGEYLEFTSYDVSVHGVLIELTPGEFIKTVQDARNLVAELHIATIFVHDLELSAEVVVVWVREDEGKILLGLDFTDLRQNAKKLWMQRHFYRKPMSVPASFLFNEEESQAQAINISEDGMRLKLADWVELEVGDAIKLFVQQPYIKALAVVVWVNAEEREMGVRYLKIR